MSHIHKSFFLCCNSDDNQSKKIFSTVNLLFFVVVFREFQSLIQSLICQTITLSVSSCSYTFLQWILTFCQFIGFYFIQLLQLVSLFHLFVVVFWLSKHSHHQFRFRTSRNKSIRIEFLHIFQVIFCSNLSFLYLALNHSHPFSSILRCPQLGLFVPCLDIYSVLDYLTTI